MSPLTVLCTCREVYLIADGLAKLHAPTPEVAPLLLSMMAHLSEGLDIRPTKPALHMNIMTTPPSQLLKLAHSIKVRRHLPSHAVRCCTSERSLPDALLASIVPTAVRGAQSCPNNDAHRLQFSTTECSAIEVCR